MPTTVNRGYDVPTTGCEVGVWGVSLNANFTAIDTNLGGLTTVALSSSNVTLSASQYANGVVRLTGVLTTNVNVVFPVIQGWWTIDNQTTGLFAARITIGSGQVIATEQGSAQDILIDGTNVKFRNLPPVGTYLDLIDATVPIWISNCTVPPYLICDGTTFSAVTYPYLNTKLGGTTLPDLRGRARYYLDGGTGRITTAGSGIDGATRLSAGGAQTVTLTTGQMPSHSHGVSDPQHHHSTQRGGNDLNNIVTAGGADVAAGTAGDTTGDSSTGISINFSGSDQAHNNMSPACIGGITLVRAG